MCDNMVSVTEYKCTNCGLKFYDDGTFTINTFCINYIKKLEYIHNAADFGSA